MNDTKKNPNESEKFLRMRLSTLQKRYNKLAKEYATRLSPSTDGIETLSPEPGKSVFHQRASIVANEAIITTI